MATLAAGLAWAGGAAGAYLLGGTDGALHRLTLRFAAGAVLFHLLLTLYDLVGVRWSLPAVALGLAAFTLGLHRLFRHRPEPARLPSDWGWGDGLALFALGVFTLFAATLWVTTPDFVYHWGIKGHRFLLARGVDYAWLAAPWNWIVHPDYPNLVPELYAVTALLRGGFRAEAMMLWSPLVFALTLGSAREALARAGVAPFFRQATLALVAVTAAAFSLANWMAGGADGWICLALLAAVPALLRPVDREGDLAVGLAGALAAASKVEGVVLAALLAGVQLLRQVRRPGSRAARAVMAALVRRALLLGAPTLLVALPWLLRVRHHGLFQEFNAGAPAPERFSTVLATLSETLAVASPWHGFAALLALLPLLLLSRRVRPVAAVMTLQLLFYLYVFVTARVDTVLLIKASFPRLVLHLLPALLVAAAVAWGEEDRERGGRAAGEPAG